MQLNQFQQLVLIALAALSRAVSPQKPRGWAIAAVLETCARNREIKENVYEMIDRKTKEYMEGLAR